MEDIDLFTNLTKELDKESERALAVLAAAYLDYLLGQLIATQMVVDTNEVEKLLMEGATAPLSSFSSRIDMAYCLGLVDKSEQRDLNLIRKIRNDFAHKFSDISFNAPQIASRCRELSAAKIGGQPDAPKLCYRKASVRLMVNILIQIRSDSE